MTTLHPALLTTLRRGAIHADARRRAQRGRQAARRLAWARLGRLLRRAHRLLPAPSAAPLPQHKAC